MLPCLTWRSLSSFSFSSVPYKQLHTAKFYWMDFRHHISNPSCIILHSIHISRVFWLRQLTSVSSDHTFFPMCLLPPVLFSCSNRYSRIPILYRVILLRDPYIYITNSVVFPQSLLLTTSLSWCAFSSKQACLRLSWPFSVWPKEINCSVLIGHGIWSSFL